jgi:hypothetical protein
MASNHKLALSSKSNPFHKQTIGSRRSQEQAYKNHPNRIIGGETNIWAIGAVIHYLTTTVKGTSSKAFSWKCQGAVNPISTQVVGLREAFYFKYNRTLFDTIFMCLVYDPAIRIKAVDLVKLTIKSEALYDGRYAGIDIGDDPLRNTDLPNIQPLGHALLYDANGNGQLNPQPLDLGLVGS